MPSEKQNGPMECVSEHVHTVMNGVDSDLNKKRIDQINGLAPDPQSVSVVPNDGLTSTDKTTHPECQELNGDGSECDSNQQWTKVIRPSNARQSQRKKLRFVDPKEPFQPNGHPEPQFRPRSFRGSRDHGFSYRTTSSATLPRNRPTQHANVNVELPNENSYQSKPERGSLPDNKLLVSVPSEPNRSGVNSSTASSPSASVSSPDLQNGYDRSEDKVPFRPPGRPSKNRRGHNPLGENDGYSGRGYARFRQNSSPVGVVDNGNTATNARPMSRLVRSPTSPVGPITNQFHGGHDDQWRHPGSGGNWRRPHHTMSYSSRGQPPYHRFNAAPPHSARTYNNTAARYRASALPNSTEVEPVDVPATTVNNSPSDPQPPPVSTPAVEKQTAIPEKRTSWAAAVASNTSRTEPVKPRPLSPCTDPSRTKLLSFLQHQWLSFLDRPHQSV
ncbi:unnamed protein product [Calicophoron daubneyi]|uniref:Uncharacterized protein n=1 Tax=Calicophoron daubneyi TaxID=300641 RepID=A0AAV2TQ29_CALDB